MGKYNNFIFDLDGTIINSSEEVLICMKKAFERASVSTDESRFNSDVIGPPIKIIIQNLAPELDDEDKIKEIIANFREIYDNSQNDISSLYDGIEDFLTLLKQQGKKIFMATFKPKKPTMRIIEQFGLNYFDDVYTIDKFDKNMTKTEMITDIIEKYGLKKEETVMIGDAKSDMTAGKEAGVTSAGVLWGYGKNKDDVINSADFVADNVKELEAKTL